MCHRMHAGRRTHRALPTPAANTRSGPPWHWSPVEAPGLAKGDVVQRWEARGPQRPIVRQGVDAAVEGVDGLGGSWAEGASGTAARAGDAPCPGAQHGHMVELRGQNARMHTHRCARASGCTRARALLARPCARACACAFARARVRVCWRAQAVDLENVSSHGVPARPATLRVSKGYFFSTLQPTP